jgi:hypothetical protein
MVEADRFEPGFQESLWASRQSTKVTRSRREKPNDARSTRQSRNVTSRRAASWRWIPVRRLVSMRTRLTAARSARTLARLQPVRTACVSRRSASCEPESSTLMSLDAARLTPLARCSVSTTPVSSSSATDSSCASALISPGSSSGGRSGASGALAAGRDMTHRQPCLRRSDHEHGVRRTALDCGMCTDPSRARINRRPERRSGAIPAGRS